MTTLHDDGHGILAETGGRPLWRYVYLDTPKPHLHPLRTPAGHVLTDCEPDDHSWQRGLWFAIKFVNGHNFWEERDEGFGRLETVGRPRLKTAGGVASLATHIRWRPPRGAPLIDEERRLVHRPLGPDAYALDFSTVLHPRQAVTLDRTPFTTWGGYGGLTLRGRADWRDARLRLADGSTTLRPTGVRARWCELAGRVGEDAWAGAVLVDHPTNPRHPSPWYGGADPIAYVNAAFLFHESLILQRGEALALRYRVVIHDGAWDPE